MTNYLGIFKEIISKDQSNFTFVDTKVFTEKNHLGKSTTVVQSPISGEIMCKDRCNSIFIEKLIAKIKIQIY